MRMNRLYLDFRGIGQSDCLYLYICHHVYVIIDQMNGLRLVLYGREKRRLITCSQQLLLLVHLL
jgi:hypothetical protein